MALTQIDIDQCAAGALRGSRRRGRLNAAWSLATLIALIGSQAPAQSLRVRAFDATDRTPLEGVIISLVAADDRRLSAALTSERGIVEFPGPLLSGARVRAERVGYENSTMPVQPQTGDAWVMDVQLTRRPRALAGVSVTARPSCTVAGTAAGASTAALWDEIRKALLATTLSTRASGQLAVWRYVRSLDPSLRVVAESTSRRVTTSDPGFVSADPEVLSREGFVREVDGDRFYFAPTAGLLLSDSFVRDHCFAVRSPPGSPVVGLGFEPMPTRVVPDIGGVLWVERQTGELRWLDFNYRTHRRSDTSQATGGQIAFTRLPNGEWIVSRWHLRTAMAGVIRETRITGIDVAQRDTLLGFHEEGGWVERGQGERGSAGMAVVEGVVQDSTTNRPLSAARVVLGGGAGVGTTDSTGRYRLTVPSAGRYAVTIRHPRFELFGLEDVSRDVVVAPGTTTRADWSVPAAAGLRQILCGSAPTVAARTLLVRVVDGGAFGSVSGAVVRVAWRLQRLRRAGEAALAVTADSSYESSSGTNGVAVFCQLPQGALRVSAQSKGLVGNLDLPDVEGALTDTTVVLRRADTRPLFEVRGKVVARGAAEPRPLEGSEVVVTSASSSTRTGTDGTFLLRGLARGAHTILVRSMGYAPQLVRTSIPAETSLVVVLEPSPRVLEDVRVTAAAPERGAARGFAERRATSPGGAFLGREELEKHEGRRLSDLLRTVSGARIERARDGKTFLVSRRGTASIRNRSCYAQIYLDGSRIYAPGEPGPAGDYRPPSLEDFRLEQIEAIEVYAGPAVTPPRFSGLGAACATLLLWTRAGTD